MKITVVAVSAPALYELFRFKKEYAEHYGEDALDMPLFYVAMSGPKLPETKMRIAEAVRTADATIIDIMGASESFQEMIGRALSECKGHRIVIGNGCREYLRLGTFSMDMMKKKEGDGQLPVKDAGKPKKNAAKMMHTMRRMALMMGSVAPFGMMKDMKNVFRLIDYWQQAGREDMDSFMHLLLREYFGKKELAKPHPCTMRYGIYLKNPENGWCTDSLKSYWRRSGHCKGKKTVALLFYGHSYPNDFLPVVQALYQRLSLRFNVLPVAFSQNEDKDLDKLEAYLCGQEWPVSGVVNVMPFRLGAGPMGGNAEGAVRILEKLKVPYWKPFCLTKTTKEDWEWEHAVNPGEFLISILLPELDGGIHTYPVGIAESAGCGEEISDITRMAPIAERIETLCSRLERFLQLQEKPNCEKKLVLICYNYPPGEDNLFGGAFLDTFASVSRILKGLKEAGYKTEDRSPEELKNIFCADGMCNSPQWADSAKADCFWELHGTAYPIRGIRCGNVFIGLQPDRAEDGMNEDAYHDRNREPPKAYQAFYRWIEEGYQADAMIHVGTHGTLEFLPGRDNGMTEDCWPDRLAGRVPHFYYYYIGNPSEAMTAKRRSHGVLLSYRPPEFAESGLYGEFRELKEMIGEYRESVQSAPEKCEDLLENIGALARKAGLSGEKPDAEVSARTLDTLEERLYEYETSLIPGGLHIIGEDSPEEIGGLLKALRGEYVPVGIAGDIFKNPDLLPAGRNLVQFDPRLVPTRTACERGMRIAEQTLERYRLEHGAYPDSAAVILWGLETSRTQGETIGQILYYLGVRMKKYEGSFDSRLEIIPAEELGRPRVDVVIHICGFFRDMFPNLLENLNEIFRKLSLLHETDEQSSFARNTRKNYRLLLEKGLSEEEAGELSGSRIFGPREGAYGTRLTETVRKGIWEEAEELGRSFAEDLSYVYSSTKQGVPAAGLLDMNYSNVQMISQVRSQTEYELTDLDHYYEFYGGLSKAVENVRGEKAAMYVADTAGKEIRTQDVKDALERGIYTRLLNPRWIEGMMKHDYHGVQQIARRFENVMGFAATTDRIESRVFSDLEKCYVEDEKLRRRLQRSNRWAYVKVLERLMEAGNRGYWDASEEELSRVRHAYLETEGEIER